jgi:hypothetical protein
MNLSLAQNEFFSILKKAKNEQTLKKLKKAYRR